MHKIRISAGQVSATALLKENDTAEALWKALPLEASANTWGDEIYFGIPIRQEEADDATDVVEVGELGFWPPGHAFCIFFGRTPASRGNECRAASAVNVLGKIEGDATVFKKIRSGEKVRIEKVEE
jgi:hypothetical protein